MTHRYTRALWFVPLAAVTAIAATWYGGTDIEPGLQSAKTGVVLDAATGKPLQGIYVGARFLQQTSEPSLLGGKQYGQCVYRVVVQTDAQGRYTIPATSAEFGIAHGFVPGERKRYNWDLYTYAAGYQLGGLSTPVAHPRTVDEATASTASTLEPILLSAEHDSAQQRLSTLADTVAHFTCHPFAHDAGPIEQSVAAEAAAAACLPGAENAAPSCTMFRQASNGMP